jgi:hypothetical protein
MGLGNKKGHVDGMKVSGGHTTLIDGTDGAVKKIRNMPWLESVRPAEINPAHGGKVSVTIRRHANAVHKNTLKLIFRKSGAAQDIYIHVRDLDANLSTVVSDISEIVRKELRGADVYDRTMECIEDTREQVAAVTNVAGADLLAKWSKKK